MPFRWPRRFPRPAWARSRSGRLSISLRRWRATNRRPPAREPDSEQPWVGSRETPAVMGNETPESRLPTPDFIEQTFRRESRRVHATLIRLLGDCDLAEEALQDAFAAAVERWPAEGAPANPRAWLVSTGRFKAIDALRRRSRFDDSAAAIAERLGDGITRSEEHTSELQSRH